MRFLATLLATMLFSSLAIANSDLPQKFDLLVGPGQIARGVIDGFSKSEFQRINCKGTSRVSGFPQFDEEPDMYVARYKYMGKARIKSVTLGNVAYEVRHGDSVIMYFSGGCEWASGALMVVMMPLRHAEFQVLGGQDPLFGLKLNLRDKTVVLRSNSAISGGLGRLLD